MYTIASVVEVEMVVSQKSDQGDVDLPGYLNSISLLWEVEYDPDISVRVKDSSSGKRDRRLSVGSRTGAVFRRFSLSVALRFL
jgi:hypothetical protein